MGTFLFDDVIFGPVRSRRLGISLGVNLLPMGAKVCNFNCIYCECGWSEDEHGDIELPSRSEVRLQLEKHLKVFRSQGRLIDTITFAGNGEPTLHPEFSGIIDDTVLVRNAIFPESRIAVLSNSTMISNETVFKALFKVDQRILKIDSAFEETIRLINQPSPGFSLEKTMANLKKFNGEFVLQTMFIKGFVRDVFVDNTSEKELNAWIEVVKLLNPTLIMIYSIARDTPMAGLEKVDGWVLHGIADKLKELGFSVQVSD